MSPDDLADILEHDPFTPFRLFLRDSSTVEINRKAEIVHRANAILIGMPGIDDEAQFYGKARIVRLADVLCWEMLAADES